MKRHGGLGNLDDLDLVDRLASIQLQNAPRRRELASLACVEIPDVSLRWEAAEYGFFLGWRYSGRPCSIETLDEVRRAFFSEVVESGL
jgi:hypothetical protein